MTVENRFVVKQYIQRSDRQHQAPQETGGECLLQASTPDSSASVTTSFLKLIEKYDPSTDAQANNLHLSVFSSAPTARYDYYLSSKTTMMIRVEFFKHALSKL